MSGPRFGMMPLRPAKQPKDRYAVFHLLTAERPFDTRQHHKDMDAVRDWCRENLAYQNWTTLSTTVYIGDEQDAFNFRMRWC